jgi:hypothetical protein
VQVTVVYESLYGNTHRIAAAIARGIAETQPEAEVELVAVADAQPLQVARADLLVVGGPTHVRGMSTRLSRHLAVTAEGKKPPEEQHLIDGRADGPGLRDWFTRVPGIRAESRAAAAFDTRLGTRFAGGAARGIAARLRRLGYRLVVHPEGFLVGEHGEGPLVDGELNRAHAWGAELARRVAPVPVG